LNERSKVSRFGWTKNTFGAMAQIFSKLNDNDDWVDEFRLFKTKILVK
jgi:hypothetical protein